MTDHRSYHEGELAVQTRAGVGPERLYAEEMYRPAMGAGVARFLAAQHIAVISSMDGEGYLWASMRSGQPGFLRALDELTLEIAGYGHPGDPLLANLAMPAPAGALVMNLVARQRVRLNGEAQVDSAGRIRMIVNQVYGNCQKYIQAREIKGEHKSTQAPARFHEQLDDKLRLWLETADTFFLATAHPQSGLDASHRGGKPGFVLVENENRFVFPDYRGNMMFNSLGNITSYPRAGLLFPDFQSGAALQLSGTASVIWEGPQMAQFPGAQRLVAINVERILELPQAMLLQFEFKNSSPHLR